MRRAVVTAIILSGLPAACSAGTIGPPPAPPVDWPAFDVHRPGPATKGPTAKERALAEGYAAALASPGEAQLAARLDDDPHFAFPGMSDARGRDQVVKAHERLFGAFDERKIATTRVWRTDSTQALEWTLAGVQARDWMGVTATHKPVVFKGLTLLWTKDDGSITDVHVYFDVAVVKAQLGVGPKELQGLPPPAWPSATPEVLEQTGAAEELANVAVVRAELNALESHAETAYVAGVAEEIEVHSPERAQPARGKEEAARGYFKSMHKAIAQLDTTIGNAWGITSFAIVEYWIAGDQIGPVAWVPTVRDRVVRLDIVDVAEIHDGKITRIWRYDNLVQLAAPGP